MRRFSSRHAVAAACAALAACGASGPTALFTVADSPAAQELAATPWPSDLFLQDGKIALARLPTDTVDLTPIILGDLAAQDGFGVTTGAWFPVSAAPDASTLSGNVRLFQLDGSGMAAEVAIDVLLRSEDKPPRIFARPKNGVVLREKSHYAYVVTKGVRTATAPLGRSADFDAAMRGTKGARVQTAIGALSSALAAGRLPLAADDIVVAAVFTTHSVTSLLTAARAQLQSLAAPAATVSRVYGRVAGGGVDGTLDELLGTPVSKRPGVDNAGGIAHDHLAFVVQGTMPSPDYLGGGALTGAGGTPTAINVIDVDGSGAPMVRGTATVPFTLVIPDLGASPASYAGIKIAIFQHGLGSQRSVLMALADDLAAQGIATLGIDFPFHGSRNKGATDSAHSFGPGAGPDGWAEVTGTPPFDFFDVSGNAANGIAALEPAAIRAAFQQASIDIMQEVRFVQAGDLTAVRGRDALLAQLSFSGGAGGKVAYSGESFGAILGGIAIAVEPQVGAAVLDVGGGGLIFPLLLNSATQGPIFGVLLDAGLGTDTSSPGASPPESNFAYNALQFLLEDGDPLAYAPYVVTAPLAGAAPKHVLQFSAHLDETVPNKSNLALAGGLGLTPARLPSGGDPALADWPGAAAAMDAPLSGNAGGVTAAFVQLQPATHVMLTSQRGQRAWDLTTTPFTRLATPMDIDNPIERLHKIYVGFLGDFLAGRVPVVTPGL